MSTEQGVYEWLKRIVRPPSPLGPLVGSSSPTPAPFAGYVRLLALLGHPRHARGDRGPHPPHRLHPRNALRRLLGLYRQPRARRPRLFRGPPRGAHRHDLLHRRASLSLLLPSLHRSRCHVRSSPTDLPLPLSLVQPCGLQLFHLLSPSSTHTGGHNLLVDGFRAASRLKSTNPSAHALLSTVPIPSHASGSGSASLPSGVHLRPLVRVPVLNYDEHGELVMVRWNGDDRGVVGGEAFEGDTMDAWYEALRAWESILRSEEAQLWSQMEVGTAVSASSSSLTRLPSVPECVRLDLMNPSTRSQSSTTCASFTVARPSAASAACAARTSTATTTAAGCEASSGSTAAATRGAAPSASCCASGTASSAGERARAPCGRTICSERATCS